MLLEKGSQGAAVLSLQQMLNRLHFEGRKNPSSTGQYDPLVEDGIFGSDTEDAVLDFQKDAGLYADGRAGPVTLAALEHFFTTRQIELAAPIVAPSSGHLTIESGPADKYGEGYGRVRLRSDVMAAYKSVYSEVSRQGGLLTSSGGIRDLRASVNSNRSATSFHYSGRALDLFIWSGMKNPDRDPYVAKRLGDRRYHVYARCHPDRAASGALPAKITISDVVTYTKPTKGVSVTDHFLDLTALFATHGFKPIRARKTFETGASGPLGAEWWHFQWEIGLIAGQTTFGAELKQIYPLSALEGTPPWRFKDYVWQQQWF